MRGWLLQGFRNIGFGGVANTVFWEILGPGFGILDRPVLEYRFLLSLLTCLRSEEC